MLALFNPRTVAPVRGFLFACLPHKTICISGQNDDPDDPRSVDDPDDPLHDPPAFLASLCKNCAKCCDNKKKTSPKWFDEAGYFLRPIGFGA